MLQAEQPNLHEGNAPLTIIPRDHSYAIDVDVDIDSDSVEAGLVLYYSQQRYVGFSLSNAGIGLRRGSHLELFEAMAGVRKATLRLINDDQEVDFFYRTPGGDWVQVASGQEVSGWHHTSFGGFVALRAGLFSAGAGTATFRNFTYTSTNDSY